MISISRPGEDALDVGIAEIPDIGPRLIVRLAAMGEMGRGTSVSPDADRRK